MQMLSKILCFFLMLTHFDNANGQKNTNKSIFTGKYDTMNQASSRQQQLLCYSRYDRSRVVRCSGGCVSKTIISRKHIDGEYSLDFHVRFGCDSRTFVDALNGVKCDSSIKNGGDYTLDYVIKGQDASNSRLFIRKMCCFQSKCNTLHVGTRRSWIRSNSSMRTALRDLHRPRGHVLPTTVALLLLFLMAYGIVTLILKWIRTKKMSLGSLNCREIDVELIDATDFQESSIKDTEIKVSGRLNIKEIAQLLAQLPDVDTVKFAMSKSLSSEDSTKETKKMPVVMDSEINVTDRKTRKVVLKAPLKTQAVGCGHSLWNTNRTINSPNDLLYRLIEHGPYQYPFTALELLSLFEETAFKMADEPSLLQIDPDITIIGDIRGRYVDLHRWLQLTGWPPENRILFLGGILDSDEPGSVECLALICSLKCRFPKHVYILRGEPETSPFRMSQRLHPVITRAVQSCIKRMCSQIPFAAIIGKSILAVYSGFSPMIREKGHIHHLFRPVTSEHLNAVEKDIIFNEPSNKVRMYRPNPKAEGNFFGKQAVKRACKSTRCNVMIRGRSHVPFGYLPCWNNRLINLWSAPGYGSNYGAVLYVSKDLEITPILMEKQTI